MLKKWQEFGFGEGRELWYNFKIKFNFNLMKEKHTKEALGWIVAVLREHKIPFQISGGFAARIYGAQRFLHDIDIDVPEKYLPFLAILLKNHLIHGLQKYHDHEFIAMFLTLRYKGQIIEISGCKTGKLFNKKERKWKSYCPRLAQAQKKKIFNMIVPVIKESLLIHYKKEIGRPRDWKDIEGMKEKA